MEVGWLIFPDKSSWAPPRTPSRVNSGGDGFLTFHFEKAGGRCGRLDLLLHHGDLVVMDRCLTRGTKKQWN